MLEISTAHLFEAADEKAARFTRPRWNLTGAVWGRRIYQTTSVRNNHFLRFQSTLRQAAAVANDGLFLCALRYNHGAVIVTVTTMTTRPAIMPITEEAGKLAALKK